MNRLARIFLLLFCSTLATSQDFTQPSSDRISAAPYWTAVGAAVASTAADAATTLVMIKPQNRCNAEVSNPTLFGRQPKPARTIAVMGATTAGAALISYKLRKFPNRTVRRFWLAPLAAIIASHADGAVHNLIVCR